MPTRVDDLWFPKDSTIVIRAENKIFLVSGAILAARSTVFRDMLAFPQPTSGNTEQIDGSPVVRLHDPALDVEVFLRAIFDSSYFMPAPAPIELAAVLAILRLSNKYDIQYLYRRALEHLHQDGWYTPNYDDEFKEHLLVPPMTPMTSMSVITAAMEVGALWLVPYARYCVSTYYTDQLRPFLQGSTEPLVRAAFATHTDLIRATVAVNRFLIMREPCATAASCNRVRDVQLAHLLDEISAGRGLHPRTDWTDKALETLKIDGMCDACFNLAKTRNHEAVTAFWDKLPSIFGLPPWEELRAMKRAAMGEEDEEEESDENMAE
ncbi:hypothetical protein FB451DRAFT_1031830 [Mycena latifolia]|nr:hypothetical protein FB451DRAFT_1031830 [Mycena latifolia]